jgi:L-lactate permease
VDWFLAALAVLPILIVGVLVVFSWPVKKAMPLGWLTAGIIAFTAWDMPVRWLSAATLGGFINTIDILIIVFGALLTPVPEGELRHRQHCVHGIDFQRNRYALLPTKLSIFTDGLFPIGRATLNNNGLKISC